MMTFQYLPLLPFQNTRYKPYGFDLMTEDEKVFYPLAADSQAEMEEWTTILTRAIGSEMEDNDGEGMCVYVCVCVCVCVCVWYTRASQSESLLCKLVTALLYCVLPFRSWT